MDASLVRGHVNSFVRGGRETALDASVALDILIAGMTHSTSVKTKVKGCDFDRPARAFLRAITSPYLIQADFQRKPATKAPTRSPSHA